MINIFKRMAQDIRDGNFLEHYITLLFILVIFFLDIFGFASPDILAEITLAVLALVVFGSLNTRESVKKLADKFEQTSNADNFFWAEKTSVEPWLQQAKQIGFVGASLSRTLRDYSSVLENRLREGAAVRVVLMDPASGAPDQAVLRSKGINNRQFYIDSLRPSLERVGALAQRSQAVELGLLPYKPAFGMMVIDPNESSGVIIVEMYPHHADSFAPTFELRPNRDPVWYSFFREQYEALWAMGCKDRQFTGDEIQGLLEEVRNIK